MSLLADLGQFKDRLIDGRAIGPVISAPTCSEVRKPVGIARMDYPTQYLGESSRTVGRDVLDWRVSARPVPRGAVSESLAGYGILAGDGPHAHARPTRAAGARAFVRDELQPREAEFERAAGRVPRDWRDQRYDERLAEVGRTPSSDPAQRPTDAV